MAQTVSIILRDEDRERLAAIACDRSRPLKHIQRAKIVLFSAEWLPVLEIARRAGVSRLAVWRWQQRYAEDGVDGLGGREDARMPFMFRRILPIPNLAQNYQQKCHAVLMSQPMEARDR